MIKEMDDAKPITSAARTFLGASLDYGEEMHMSRILGKWSNMIGYEMGSSTARVYTMAKTSPMKNFKHGWKNWHGCQHGNTFCYGEFSRGQVSWPTSKPHIRNLTSRELQLLRHLFIYFSILSTIPIVASNNLVLRLKFLTDQCTSSP